MPRVRPPFRAEHVGSFIRPAVLYEKRILFEQGQCTQKDLQQTEDEAIKNIVKLQQAIGIKSVSDGEFRREIFYDGVFNKLGSGMKVAPRPIEEFLPYVPNIAIAIAKGLWKEYPSFYCTGKIERTESFYVKDFNYLKSCVDPKDVENLKMTICASTWIHQRHGSKMTYDLSVYKNDDEYFEDLAVAYRSEIRELYEAGCRHIQIDNPSFCYLCDAGMITGMEKAGVNYEDTLDSYIRAMNMYTTGRPADLTISVHMCRGNFKGAHFAEGSYSRVARKLFNDLDVDAFYLEYDDHTRAGDFSPLGHFPRNKIAVLGLVTTKVAELELVTDLQDRVNQAVDAICEGDSRRTRKEALDQLCISTQCGFASVWQGNPVTEEDQRKKLQLLVQAAEYIWKE